MDQDAKRECGLSSGHIEGLAPSSAPMYFNPTASGFLPLGNMNMGFLSAGSFDNDFQMQPPHSFVGSSSVLPVNFQSPVVMQPPQKATVIPAAITWSAGRHQMLMSLLNSNEMQHLQAHPPAGKERAFFQRVYEKMVSMDATIKIHETHPLMLDGSQYPAGKVLQSKVQLLCPSTAVLLGFCSSASTL